MKTRTKNTTNAGGRVLTLGFVAAIAAYGIVTMIARAGALYPVLGAIARTI